MAAPATTRPPSSRRVCTGPNDGAVSVAETWGCSATDSGPRYSRLKALFRLVLAIPIFILQYVMQIWLLVWRSGSGSSR